MSTKVKSKNETANGTNPVLSAAALKWWNGLPTFRRKMFMNMHYSDDFPSNDRIMTLYKMYKDDETDTYEDFGSC
jgi:hypothetical protein